MHIKLTFIKISQKTLIFPSWQSIYLNFNSSILCENHIWGSITVETKVIFIIMINQWRVMTQTLCWSALECSLNSSRAEADPQLFFHLLGGQQQGNQTEGGLQISIPPSVAPFHLDGFRLVWIFDLRSRFYRLFSPSWNSKPLWKIVLKNDWKTWL